MESIDHFLYFIDMDTFANIRIRHAHRAFCAPGWSWDSRVASFEGLNLWFIASGHGHLRIEMEHGVREFPLEPGDCFLLRGHEHMLARHDPSRPLVVPFLILDLAPGCEPPHYRKIDDAAFFDTLLDRAIRAHEQARTEEACTWVSCALHDMDRTVHPGAHAGVAPDVAALIHEEAQHMRRDPASWSGIAGLAGRLCCTSDHAIRLFKAVCGTTPAAFLITARMASARALLRGSSLSIGQIAASLGYRDIGYFSRQFTLRHGESPLAYRRREA